MAVSITFTAENFDDFSAQVEDFFGDCYASYKATPQAIIDAKADPFPASDNVGAEPEPAKLEEADVRKRITDALAKAGGDKTAVVALLDKFGAKTVKQLKPEQYAEFMAQSEGLVA